MEFNNLKATLRTAAVAVSVLLVGVSLAVAQQQVNLAAGPTTVTLPDGAALPMWGYSCGAVVSGSTATCAKLNPAAAGWSPVVITVPTGPDLTINLSNNLSFIAGTETHNIPTSLVIVGQLGGGLGKVTERTTTTSPDHPTQNATWPIAGSGSFNPPGQPNRVQSFSTEVPVGSTSALTWKAPRPGTYLIESGTHPSIQGPMGLYGILVVTAAPTADTTGKETAPGTAYPNVSYDAEVPVLLSEIDPVQNNAVNAAVNAAGFSETAVWSGQPNGCGNPSSSSYRTCYPPTVNYSPLYYLLNGVAFDKTNAPASLFPVTPANTLAATGNVLVRFVNAGLRMHVPSIVGSLTGSTPVAGFSLIAEDGNPLPGVTRVQSEVFLAAGKTYDVMVNVPAACTPVPPATACTTTALPVFDRQLSLSGNATARDTGMLAYLSVNGASLPNAGALAAAIANADSYTSVIPGQTLILSDPSKGVIANDINVYGVKVSVAPAHGALTLSANGTFTYIPDSSWSLTAASPTTSDTFVYQANGNGPIATVTLGEAPIEGAAGITLQNMTFTSNVATYLNIKSPGVLSGASDAKGYPLTVVASSVTPAAGLTVVVNPQGGFKASVLAAGTYTFTYQAQNTQGTVSAAAAAATVTLIFPQPSNLHVSVLDGRDKVTPVSDYRWIIEEDRTFYISPNPPANTPGTVVPTFGTNFHTSYMPVVAQGCTGTLSCEGGQTLLGQAAVCDGDGVCSTAAAQETAVDPSQVYLDPTKRYYISVLPGDAGNSFENTNNCLSNPTPSCGHGMGGAPIAPAQGAVSVLVQPNPFPPSKLSVFVFEDDFPLNGEQDAGGGVDVLAVHEPGLGQFNITLMDDAGGSGDPTGQMTYDMFNQPLSNSLAGTIDPATGFDACPISTNSRSASDPTSTGITGTIVTCPKYEAGGTILSPLAGQAVIANLMPGRYGVVATPGADRIAKGEEWLQTNTLDGQKAHDSFLRIGEPSFFQEFGPAGYHVTIGFANPQIINARKPGICAGLDENVTGVSSCTSSVSGKITTERMSRTPDERLYSSGDNSSFAFTQCYVSLGDPDGEDFAFTKCAADGTFNLSGLPNGSWRITVFDQWNDMLVDGLSTPVALSGGAVNMGDIAMNQWQANFSTRTFLDTNKDGVSQGTEPGLALVKTNVRYRDGSFSNRNNTDLNGYAAFNEEFPLFSWYVIETDVTRYKNTGTHVVYDAGGPPDGAGYCGTTNAPSGYPPCGPTSSLAANKANTVESSSTSLPANLRVPGAVYCGNANCDTFSIANGPSSSASATSGVSTGRIDPPWVLTEGWQGFSGQNNFLEFGKAPYVPGENGGIRGHVVYSSTRPFDDPQVLVQNVWEPMVPNVTMNLYMEGTAPDGSISLTLVDTTQTSSWDNWAQGFRSDHIPNMNCPGQSTADLFYFTLQNQPNFLDVYNSQHGGSAPTGLPNGSQFKCYDGMHNWNQLQPAPYDGMYQFPSVTGMDPVTGKPTGTNCTACVANPDASDPYRHGLPMLQSGKRYVVEVVVPPGYELVKEEDKNILIGDNFIAPVTQEFGGLGNIFILPDQAMVDAYYNANNSQNPTQNLGSTNFPRHEGDTPTVETFWPCVGQSRIVPDYISLFPQSKEVSPFAGATRNLCDRKEVALADQESGLAEFYIFTSTHVAAHFTGVITDDFTSEFDPFSPQFGEKFSPANLPVAIKDWTGSEISRVYSDQWGAYDGLTYSTWEVNPPNPTGYSPTMMVTCMNDAGTGPTPDPQYNPQYSQFCYEIPFMPGQTQYMDTPVVPTSAFAGAGYNNPDCAYPDATPAIKQVNGDGVGPWVSAAGKTLTIAALGDQIVSNYGYSGPSATTAPFNQKTVSRHYGFGSQCTSPTAGNATCNTLSSVTIGGVAATITGWSDTSITVTAPSGVPACAIQQQALYAPGATTASCGQLVITAGNGRQSIDTVTITIGGKAPIPVTSTIQSAIDAAMPGDLIIVPPGVYNEMLLFWKPVRLQGVGAASSVLNANTHPAGKLDPWRAQVSCLFGLALNGQPLSGVFDPTGVYSCPGTGWNYFTNGANNQPQVDRLPMEGVLGWDTSQNGNLAQLLQEPTLMGAYEGAGITVLSKGVNTHGAQGYFGNGTAESAFPTGTTLLTSVDCDGTYPSNFQCNPSGIDGLSITNSSQGGGGILVHAWGHNLQIANNRVYNNSGTLTGGITIGQGESPDAYLAGTAFNTDPGSCESGGVTNSQLPYCFDTHVNVHHNAVTSNSSIGDELYSSTPAGSGGVTFCTGADYYKFNYNWVCGNLSTGDGGGVAHMGFIKNGDIEHNAILFNQSTNPTVPANGGGLIVMGAPPDGFTAAGVECGGTAADLDCVPGLSDGTGPNLVINANLIMGNAAEAGSGGGLRFQGVNGTEVSILPTRPDLWNSVTVTNNIIANNVAGWDGAGVSLQDALNVNIINNTIVGNDTTASSGVLFNTLGAPLSSSPCPTCNSKGGTTSAPQPAGLVAVGNSPQLIGSLPSSAAITCPVNHPHCASVSYPYLANDLFWQNRSFYIGVGQLSAQYQQNIVSLYNASFTSGTPGTAVANQSTTGACDPNAKYWDIGVRGDLGPGSHDSTFTLAPTYSVLTNASEAGSGSNNLVATNPNVVSQYCNGSRIPPEAALPGGTGWQVPPGISDATVPNPIFNLTPSATVDEGNNWVNLSWGPLALTNPTGVTLGNYALAAGSPAIDVVATSSPTYPVAPSRDFFGNPRPDVSNTAIDVGAVEFQAPKIAVARVAPTSLAFGNVVVGTTSASQTLTLANSGGASLTGITVTVTAPFARPTGGAGGTCGATLASGSTCTINVVFSPTAVGAANGTATVAGNVTVNGSPVSLSGTGLAPTRTATVAPTSLAFGNARTGTTSTAQTLTVTNTGNIALAGGAFTFGGGSPQPFSRPGGNAGGTCNGTLALGASCTINVVFAPTTVATFNRTLTVAYTTATVTGSPVALSGTGVNLIVTPAPLVFPGTTIVGNTSAVQNLTLSNATGSTRSITLTFSGPFSRATGGQAGSCSTLLGLANNNSCTIGVLFKPTAVGTVNGSLAITTNGGFTVANSPVTLTGTGIAQVVSASLTPSPKDFGNAARGVGVLGAPTQVFTLTNTGNVNLTGIGQGTILGTNPSDFPVVRLFSTCGPAGNGQFMGQTTLTPGSSCMITVQFRPAAGDTVGAKSATLSVSDLAGAQTSALSGNAQ
jgi:Bacterial Ig domain